MIRAIFYFAILAGLVWGAVVLTDHPGTVSLEWAGYRIDTTFAFLIGVVALVAGLAAVIYRFWLFIRRSPGQIKWAWQAKRRQRGYQALTRGMVAVAAGDAGEAQRQAKRADGLLEEPPLTMLVSAQAAQMKGDEKAAGAFFKAMMERPETEFLGLRGLLNQAIKRGDNHEALTLARRAYRLQPKSTWVADHMFDLQTRTGKWLDARVTCDDLKRSKLIDGDEARRRKAVLLYQMSLVAQEDGDADAALDHLIEANKLAPAFIPAVADLADYWAGVGKHSKAARMIEKTWGPAPHPSLVEPYWNACQSADALERVRASEKLTKTNPDHLESHIALARAYLDALLWGEARKHLEDAIDLTTPTQIPARVCRMMAELEESENEDLAGAREWLMRASEAPHDPVWVCDHCGNATSLWSVVCGKCESFDTFAWGPPPAIAGSMGKSLSGPELLEGENAFSHDLSRLPPGGIEAG
ncbi:MAG: heme biosynthesis protein HemY [Rhodospirillales bacterium]|nr:heme biosynthesis protein HemY [Rhodospirillales bacterium]